MRNIWNSQKRKNISINIVLSIVIYGLVMIFVIVGMMGVSNNSKKQEVEEVTRQINKSISLCYAIEGMYPNDLEYLENNYGLDIDDEKYIIHYKLFASNIQPEVMVYNK